MPAKLRIEGGDAFDRNLVDLRDIMQDPNVVVPVLEDALAPVAEAARRIVPVRSGRLRDDIEVSDQAADDPGHSGIAAFVGPNTDAFYAEDVELGRPASISRSGREYDAIRPKPFMRPAWEQESDGLLPAVAHGLGEALRRKLKG